VTLTSIPGPEAGLETAAPAPAPASLCATVDRVLEPVDSLLPTSTRLGDGAAKLTSGSTTAARARAGLPQTVASMKDALGQARSASHDLLGLTETIGPQMRQLTDYLTEIDTQFQGRRDPRIVGQCRRKHDHRRHGGIRIRSDRPGLRPPQPGERQPLTAAPRRQREVADISERKTFHLSINGK
jgi:hypothetical protein